MHRQCRTSLVAALLLTSAPLARAQAPVDPSGHWEGSIRLPDRELIFELDLAKNGRGGFVGAMNNPAEHVQGLPLRTIAIEGRSVSFSARHDQPLTGTLSADGTSMSGGATLSGYVLPFSLTRTRDAEIVEPARSAPIARELEGTWNAVLEENGMARRVVLTMANQADGTATASLIDIDDGELEIPVAITRTASHVTLTSSVIASLAFSGELNADGSELTGSFTQGPVVVPATFRHGATR